MAKFITGKELEDAICSIIWDAKEKLVIVSPFIKLDEYFIQHFNHHINNPSLHLLVVFGKNEYDKSKSLNSADFEFFKRFPKVSIVYVANLHAKYYGNESKGVITSINLYDHSFKNNIEFGVFSEVTILNNFTKSTDMDAWNKCIEIADAGEPVYIKRPIYKKKLISLLGKDYTSSSVMLDNTESFFSFGNKQHTNKKLTDFADELDFAEIASARPTREDVNQNQGKSSQTEQTNQTEVPYFVSNRNDAKVEGYNGFCIRTGVKIPFNIKKPMCYEANRTWSSFGDENYPENFCHFSGEPSNGETNYGRPILKKYWKKAQDVHGFK